MFQKFTDPALLLNETMLPNSDPPVKSGGEISVKAQKTKTKNLWNTPNKNVISSNEASLGNYVSTAKILAKDKIKSVMPESIKKKWDEDDDKETKQMMKELQKKSGKKVYKKSIKESALYKKILMENMDMGHIPTVQHMVSLNEAEQNTFLVSLTNRLYQLIVNKIDDIDFGEIPSTKGNIRKMSKYNQIRECIEVLNNIFVQYKENTEPVQQIDNALSNLENNADLFIASYSEDIKLGQMIYETTALGIIEALGFMIATCIEYVKDPKKQGLSIVLNKTGVMKVKSHLLYENLIKFNEACKNNDLEKALQPLIKNKIKNFDAVTIGIAAIHIIAAIYVIIAAIIPFLKQMVYFFYATRVRMSSYLDAQADLLEMNAQELKNNPNIKTVDDKNTVIARQLRIARVFHSTADKIAIDSKTAEITATKDLKADNQKYKMDEINTNPANMDSGSLF